jgi:ribosomal protein S18 acetylase RimI-like enzyme
VELFHYHYWTPFVEETEKCYEALGFSVITRIGKVGGEFETFNPPLQWSNFRSKDILFRIIEMRKGRVNVTFGFGKTPTFDHIGILVSREEYDEVCMRAKTIGWKVEENERRTFIHTPYHLKIELQLRRDVIEDADVHIVKIDLVLPTLEAIRNMQNVLKGLKEVTYMLGEKTCLQQVQVKDTEYFEIEDDNGLLVTSQRSIEIQEITDEMRSTIKEFMIQNWGDDVMVSRGYMHILSELSGFIATMEHSIVGIVTYNMENTQCEIVSLDSWQERKGIGTMLLQYVEGAAKKLGCQEMWLITSNDNIHAMHFYQKRGYHMHAIYKGAINEARKLKPTIPYMNDEGILIESEVEFRKQL